MKYDVFISYSRKDYVDEQKNVIPGNEVSKVKDALTKAGISFWFDEEGIYSGQNFVEKIVTNIEDAKVFLFLSTTNANNSPWTCKEIASADEFKKHIIPVRIDSSPYNRKVLFRIADLDYIEYYTNPQKGMEDMIKSIQTYLAELAAEEKRKKEEELKQKKEQEEQLKRDQEKRLAKRKKILTNVRDLIAQIENHRLAQKNLMEHIYTDLRLIGISQKSCPVCLSHCELDSEYCSICGWHFATLTAIRELEIKQEEPEKNALTHYSATWENSKSASPKETSGIMRLKEENKQLLKELTELKNVCSQQKVYRYRTDENNNFPTDSDLRKWNWGAFFFGWIWGFANGIKKESVILLLLSLTIIAGPISNIYFGVYGTRLAWRNRPMESWKSYQTAQRKWMYASYVCSAVVLFLLVFTICL